MTIQTDYGMVEYEESDLLIFPDGLFGFPKLTQYLLLYLNEDDDSMLLLQSVEECKVGFVLINPFLLCPDYSPELTPEELACNYLENTVNLKSPLVINPQTRRGIQVILENSPYGYRHELRSFPTVAEPTNGSEKEHADTST